MATILLCDTCPDSYKQRLLAFGGKNSYGRPLWRIVRAEHRTHVCGGTFHEGKDGGTFEFLPNGKFTISSLNPGHVTSGEQEVTMYTCGPGWILERWLPPHVWGTREDWNSQKADDGSRLFGEYPSEGDYWMLDGPYDDLPPMSFLEKTIEVYEYCRNNQNQSFEALFARGIAKEKARAEEKYLRMMDQVMSIGREVNQVLTSSSLEGQRLRQQAGKMRGDKSHQAL
jgi:hypothetical protein